MKGRCVRAMVMIQGKEKGQQQVGCRAAMLLADRDLELGLLVTIKPNLFPLQAEDIRTYNVEN